MQNNELGFIEIETDKDLPKAANPGCLYLIKDSGRLYRWTDDWVQVFSEEQNRIVCAANKYPNGMVVPGVRHMDRLMVDILRRCSRIDSNTQPIEGFLDKFGIFHNRREAWKIAEAAGQIVRRVGGDDRGVLYSENLY